MKQRNKVVLLSAVVFLGGVSSAKTVALWPLEQTAAAGGLYCAVNPSNDLSSVAANCSEALSAVPWMLPPNPDNACHAFEPLNRSAVRETPSGDANGFLYNEYSACHLRRDKAFTVEGYIKLQALPARNEWGCVIGAYGADSGVQNVNRWTLSLRRRSNENYACSWIFWGIGTVDTVLYKYADEAASFAMTNKWMHLALVHEPLVDGKDKWLFYIDGVKMGVSTNSGSVCDGPRPFFDLGARYHAGNQLDAAFDYWRISDEALQPEDFLCAGGAGTVDAESHTVAYWPLDVTENGGIDCRDAVGTGPLTGGFFDTAFGENSMTPIEDCAFADNPPNGTVVLADGNAGSFQGAATAACLKQEAVGAFLNVTSNFTVEGWFSPRICSRTEKQPTQETCCYLFGTRPDYERGWALQYRAKGVDQIQFDLYCWDQSGVLQNNILLSGSYDMNGWYDDWRHVALVYHATGGEAGHGRWTLYIDGEQAGFTDNTRAPSAIEQTRAFILGGRAGVSDYSFQGKIDCVRVCAAALAPSQFLNAAVNGTAATDVIACWPLNVARGAYADLRDVSGNENHFAPFPSNHEARWATADRGVAPVIANPDRSPAFRGDPSSVNGSVRFRDPDAAVDNKRAALVTGNATVLNAMAGGKDFTFECYYLRRKPAANVSGYQEVFLAYTVGASAQIRFFRKADGFYIWENWNSYVPDTRFAATSDNDLEYDRWYHVALVHSIDIVDAVRKSVWRLYLDGSLKGSVSANYNNKTEACNRLYVGGRPWVDNNSVLGNLSSVRLSDRALDPSDFLCATPSAVETTEKTVGYWPIDSAQPGLANLVAGDYPLVASGTAAGQSVYARASIPNRHALTNLVAGAARRNGGSYALGSAGALTADGIGFEMTGRNSFTVEGWVNWNPDPASAGEDLVGVGDSSASYGGLRLWLDKTGASPTLRIQARGAWPCTPYVDGAFDGDLTALFGRWAHLAVVYDANVGEGTWTLYIDGEPCGNPVANFFRPRAIDYIRVGDFRIGSTAHPLAAAVDMWRVSAVAQAATDFLYAPSRATFLIVR